MAHRKREYEANGHEATIQQVNEGGRISAWIDGYAAHIDSAMQYATTLNEGLDMSVSEKIDTLQESDERWKAVETLLAVMIHNDLYFCKNCDSFYNYENVSGTGFAGHQCGECANEAATCPDNPNGNDHEDRCLNPGQKRNARVATKYKCEHCGRKRRTTPTG